MSRLFSPSPFLAKDSETPWGMTSTLPGSTAQAAAMSFRELSEAVIILSAHRAVPGTSSLDLSASSLAKVRGTCRNAISWMVTIRLPLCRGGRDVLNMEDVDGIPVGRRRQKKGDPQEGAPDGERMQAESGVLPYIPIEAMVSVDYVEYVIVLPVALDEAADIGAVSRAVTLGGVGVDADPHGRAPSRLPARKPPP